MRRPAECLHQDTGSPPPPALHCMLAHALASHPPGAADRCAPHPASQPACSARRAGCRKTAAGRGRAGGQSGCRRGERGWDAPTPCQRAAPCADGFTRRAALACGARHARRASRARKARHGTQPQRKGMQGKHGMKCSCRAKPCRESKASNAAAPARLHQVLDVEDLGEEELRGRQGGRGGGQNAGRRFNRRAARRRARTRPNLMPHRTTARRKGLAGKQSNPAQARRAAHRPLLPAPPAAAP